MTSSPNARPRKIVGRPSVIPVRPTAGKRSQDSDEPAVPSEIVVPELDAKTFEPDVSTIKKLNAKGPKALAAAQTRGREQSIQTLHSLRLLAPGVLSVMSQLPDPAPVEEQAAHFTTWATQIRERASQWAERWNVAPEDTPWVSAALERILAENPGLMKATILDEAVSWAATHQPPPSSAFIPLGVGAPLALLQALGPVQRAQAAFPLGRKDLEADLAQAGRLLLEAGTDAINELVEPATPGDVRILVFSSVVADAGKTLAQLWVAYAQDHLAKWRLKTIAEQELWLAAHPQGVTLEPLFQQFQEFGARLRRLTRAARLRK